MGILVSAMSQPTDSALKKGIECQSDGSVKLKSPFFRDPKNQQARRKKWKKRTKTTEKKDSSHYISAEEMAAMANNGRDAYAVRERLESLGTDLYRMKKVPSNIGFDRAVDGQLCKQLADPGSKVKLKT